MSSKTISLEDSAYQKLLGAKRPGESFSDVVHRLLGGAEPSFRDLRGALSARDAKKAAKVIDDLKRRDVESIRRKHRM